MAIIQLIKILTVGLVKGLKDTILNQEYSSLTGRSLEITLRVPLTVQYIKYKFSLNEVGKYIMRSDLVLIIDFKLKK